MAELKPYKHGDYLWLYVPNLAAAVIFLLCFAVATVLHIYRLFKTRTWFCIPFAAGGGFVRSHLKTSTHTVFEGQ